MDVLRIDALRPAIHIVDSDFTARRQGHVLSTHVGTRQTPALLQAGKGHQGTVSPMSHAQWPGTPRVSCTVQHDFSALHGCSRTRS